MSEAFCFSGDVQSLRLRPGDKLVISTPNKLTLETVEHLKTAVKTFAPDHEILVLSDGLRLSVLEPDSGAAPRAVAA